MEWGFLAVLSLALAVAWVRERRDPGAAISFIVAAMLALPALGLLGLGDDILSPLAVLAGVAVLYLVCLSFMVLIGLRGAFRVEPHGLLAIALLASVSVATLFQLGGYYSDLILGTSFINGSGGLMWPLFFNLWGSLLITISLVWSEPALRLLDLPEAG